MSYDTDALPALIGSRICHDLISPIGAISNGLELLGMNSQTGMGPELELIHESCAHANARIRFFRIAFGASATEQRIGRHEATQILTDMARSGRVQADWRVEGDLPRVDLQMAFLALLCAETALPLGGTVGFDHGPSGWTITAQGPRINRENGLWGLFDTGDTQGELTPSRVQFALLDTLTRSLGRRVTVTETSDALILTI